MTTFALRQLLYGKGAHADTLACVQDVPFEVVGCLPAGSPHSIYQLVWHMNFWMTYELQRIGDQNPPYPEHASQSWPAKATPDKLEQWHDAVETFRKLLAELATLADVSREALAREITPTYPGHTQLASSLEAVLWQTLVHNSYHVGQIASLRRALDAWPPKGGGDTW